MKVVSVICTVARNDEGYSVQNVKRYVVWGGVRSDSGASSSASGGHLANTDKRYCANLGHATDIETGLIYMRARYYEPTTGRFLSEDPAMDGKNWYVYCAGSPTLSVDPTGKDFKSVFGAFVAGLTAWITKVASQGGDTKGALGAFMAGVGAYLAAKIGGRVSEAVADVTSATVGSYALGMTVGGFTNMAATILINLLTDTETDFGDLFLAFLGGAIGAAGAYGLGDSPKGLAEDFSLGLGMGGITEFLSRF
mgnify:CR=1 FL=1